MNSRCSDRDGVILRRRKTYARVTRIKWERHMQSSDQHDELVMELVDLALLQEPSAREGYLHDACHGDPALIEEVLHCIAWNERMDVVLARPVDIPDEIDDESPLHPAQLL